MTFLQHLLRRLCLAAPVCGLSLASAQTYTGPSSSQSPYLIPTAPGVVSVSVLTVGDAVNFKPDGVTPYRMVGLPDGLGAFETEDDDDTFTVLMAHEVRDSAGVPREHGAKGAFVSKWIIDKETLTVLHGGDLIKTLHVWDCVGGVYSVSTNPVSRFCSADLPEASAFYDKKTKRGYKGRIFLSGEEAGAEGRAFAHFMNGRSYELPWLGKFSWENAVASPASGQKTVVVGLDDGTGGQVYVYVGRKSHSGNPLTAAGLNNGVLYGIKVTGFTAEDPSTGIPSGTKFSAFNFGDVSCMTGAQLEASSVSNAVTSFQRPEDGCWDPKNPNDFYFVTTASFTGNSRLWRLRFKDISNPAAGGRIDMLLDGTEGPKMMDNITVSRGKVFIQEDPGNQPYLARIWCYDIKKDTIEAILEHDTALFTSGAPGFLTQDEESSGIIPLHHILGKGWYLAAVQGHYPTDVELVEGGQLVALHIDCDPDDDDEDEDFGEVELPKKR
jgi:hypothetical protein